MKKLLMISLVGFSAAFYGFAQQTEPGAATPPDAAVAAQDTAPDEAEAPAKEKPVFKWPSWMTTENATLTQPPLRTQRRFELGFLNFDIGASNSQILFSDLLGGSFAFDVEKMNGDFTFDVNIFAKPISVKLPAGRLFDLSLFTTMDARIYGNMGDGTMKSINKIQEIGDVMADMDMSISNIAAVSQLLEDVRNLSGELEVAGSAFASIGASGSKVLLNDKLRLTVSPSLYFTLFYMPKKDGGITLQGYGDDTTEYFGLKSTGAVNIYTPFDIDDVGAGLFSAPGFDVSLEALYAIWPMLDAGAAIYNIPIVPSTLRYRSSANIDIDVQVPNPAAFTGWSPSSMPEAPEFKADFDFNDSVSDSKLVMRPVRFDFFALYKPYRNQVLEIIIKPNLGFSVNTVVADSCFNWGLSANLNMARVLSVTLGTSLMEKIWDQYLEFQFDFRVFELDLGVALEGPTFASSWEGKGLNANLAFKFGY